MLYLLAAGAALWSLAADPALEAILWQPLLTLKRTGPPRRKGCASTTYEGDVIGLFHSLKAAYSAAQRYQRDRVMFPFQENTGVEIEGTLSADDIDLLNILRTGDGFKIVPESDFPSDSNLWTICPATCYERCHSA